MEVGPVWAGLLSGQAAYKEGQEVPTSEKARGEACAVEALLPPVMDK